jgi:hypothetical protein
MLSRLFYPSYETEKFNFFQPIGEVLCPIIMLAIEIAQLYSLGPARMYVPGSLKFLTDFIYPIAAFVYFKKLKDWKLKDYDGYEKQQNGENILQDLIDGSDFEKIDNIFHNNVQTEESGNDLLSGLHDDTKSDYIVFVYYSFILCAIIFIKFKNQLQMNKKMNSVIQLID